MWKVQKSPHNQRVFETVLPERMELGPFFGTEHEAQEWCDTKNAKMVQDAAPDLLAALQEVLDVIGPQVGGKLGTLNTVSRIASAAVAKATGSAA